MPRLQGSTSTAEWELQCRQRCAPSLLVTATPPKTDCARLSQVAVEACLSFFFLLVGILWTAPTLKGVSYASEMSNRCVLSLSFCLARDPVLIRFCLQDR